MKRLILNSFLSISTILMLAGCGGGSCNTDAGGGNPPVDGNPPSGGNPPADFIAQITDFSDPKVVSDYNVKMVGLDSSDGKLKLTSSSAKKLTAQNDDTTFPFIWIANSGEGTISKLDVKTGEELARYRTGPSNSNGNPSRTTVDQDGNVWVGNRNGNTITKVGLQEWDQCIDRNGNGIIDTSTGGEDVMAWSGELGDGLSNDNATDECILQHVALEKDGLSADNVRLVAIDVDNNVVAGGSSSTAIFKVNPVTGEIINVATTLTNHYGGVVDKHGNIWSMPSPHNGKVQKISSDLSTTELINIGHYGYGITVDKYGKVWTTEYGSDFSTFDPADPVGTLKVFTQTGNSYAQGIATDSNGDIFIAGSLSGSTVGHYRQIFDEDDNFTGVKFVVNYPVGQGPTGVAVDGSGLVWSSNYYDDSVSRITPVNPNDDLASIQGDDLDISTYPVGKTPYNYSDMTGNVVRTITKRQGTWEGTFNSEIPDYAWIQLAWVIDQLPENTSVKVFVKAANSELDLNAKVYIEVENSIDLIDVIGQFLRVKIELASDDADSSAIVSQLSVY